MRSKKRVIRCSRSSEDGYRGRLGSNKPEVSIVCSVFLMMSEDFIGTPAAPSEYARRWPEIFGSNDKDTSHL